MRILFVAAEVAPYAKVGGLADVAGALPKALHAMGHDVRVAMPRYGQIDARNPLGEGLDGKPFPVHGSDAEARLATACIGEVPLYLVECERFFGRDAVYGFPDDADRFMYFCRAALEVVNRLGWTPDVIHSNDWHTAAIPHWLHGGYDVPPSVRAAASVFTIHNLAYQGVFKPSAYRSAWVNPAALFHRADGVFDLMSQGIAGADLINTVSERYAEEITTPEFGEGLDGLLTARQNQLRGIVNGIDYDVFDPETDPAIVARYSADAPEGKLQCKAALQQEVGFDLNPRTPVIAMIGRLVDQKGFDLVAPILDRLLSEIDLQFVILGTGDPAYHEMLRERAARNRRQLAAFLTFDAALAQRIYAGADMFLMPSRFEPCGLGQLISLRYGTVPIVRSTGGLADTVTDYRGATRRGTGFVFRDYNSVALSIALGRAFEVYRQTDRWLEIQVQGMQRDSSWTASARRYVDLYHEAIELKRLRSPS